MHRRISSQQKSFKRFERIHALVKNFQCFHKMEWKKEKSSRFVSIQFLAGLRLGECKQIKLL